MEITDNSILKIAKKYLKHNHVDFISAQDPISAINIYKIVGNKIPIILTMHSYFGKSMSELSDKRNQMRQKDFDNLLIRDLKSLKVISALVSVDTRIKNDCDQHIQKMNIQGIPSYVIPNFVKTDIYKPASPQEKEKAKIKLSIPPSLKVIICIRRLVDKNGVFYAIEAMKNVNDAILLVGGEGPNKEALSQYIIDNNLSDKVRLLGGVQGELKKLVYQAADFAIVPSITVNGLQEATSISAIEAMSCGLATIASSIGGLKELIQNDQNGILVEEKNSQQISDAINHYINDPEGFSRICNQARQSVLDHYSHLVAAQKYFEVFASCKHD
jgi:glycosyltransferase involved in cell wall biosynthesis